MSKSFKWIDRYVSKDPTHPVQIALRTYALALSLSLGPSLLPFIVALFSRLINLKRFKLPSTKTLKHVLRRELGHDGFAFSITLSVAGGAAIRNLFHNLNVYDHQSYSNGSRTGIATSARRLLRQLRGCLLYASPEQQTFISNLISSFTGILLLQAGRARTDRLRVPTKPTSAQLDRPSPTLDLTLLLLVRAVDSIIQGFILQKSQAIVNNTPSLGDSPVSGSKEDSSSSPAKLEIEQQHPEARLLHENLEKKKLKKDAHKLRLKLTSRLDALVFWACSARYVFNKPLFATLNAMH